MNPRELIRLQITLEYALDEAGRLVPFPGSSEQGLYIVYRHAQGYIPFYNHCLPQELCERLAGLDSAQAFETPDAVATLLQSYAPARLEGRFVSEFIPHPPQLADIPQVIFRDGQFVVLEQGEPVCWAWSERSNEHCAEVAVETHPAHRRKGYARRAVAAWAHQVIGSGRAALYSYKAENAASRALARSLGAAWYADVVCYST